MKRASSVVLALFLVTGLALAQTGGDKSTLNPQPLPPGRHPVTAETKAHKGGKKGHKGGKKSKKGASSGTSQPSTPPK